MSIAYIIREPRASDQAYVGSTWTASMQRTRKDQRGAKNRSRLASDVDRALDHKSTRILLAVSATDDNHILGWLAYAWVGTMAVLLYAFVRVEHRRRGIARAMAERADIPGAERVVYTFEGPDTKRLAATALYGLVRVEPKTLLQETP